MQNLNCHPELVSGSSHCDDEGSPLTPTLSRRARGKRAAFTLAEVLITLAIIGVVAAMTIPTLTQNYKKKVVETKLAKFYSTMNQAIRLSEVDNGPLISWDEIQHTSINNEEGAHRYYKTINALSWYNKYIAKYIKTAKIEEDVMREGSLGIYFNDGSLLLLSSSSWLFFPNANDLNLQEILENEYDRDKEDSGTKYFTFSFFRNIGGTASVPRGFTPYVSGWDGTREHLMNDSAVGCNKNVSNERAYCTKLLQLNNWKIPDDYPLKF